MAQRIKEEDLKLLKALPSGFWHTADQLSMIVKRRHRFNHKKAIRKSLQRLWGAGLLYSRCRVVDGKIIPEYIKPE